MIIYLAGAETHWKLMLECGVRNQLYSFFRLRTMHQRAFTEMVNSLQEEKDRRDEAGEPQLRLMLDAGVSAYLASKGKKPGFDVYFREYKECLARTKELWSCVTEMNLDLVGIAQVHHWRDELFTLHNQVIPVWQPERGESRWVVYCTDPRYQYLAFGPGLDVATKNRLCHKAHISGKLVHGMSETKMQTEIQYLRADSFGSNAWTNAQKYSALYVFHGNQLRLLDKQHKQDRKLFKAYFTTNGIDFAQVMADDPETINKCSLIAWRNLSARYEVQGERRNGRGNEAGNNATATGRDRTTEDDRQRNGTANATSKSDVDQRAAKLQGKGVNRSDSVQGGSSTGAKRSFGLHRVYGEPENAQGVNNGHNKEVDSGGQGREEVVGGGDRLVDVQRRGIVGSVRQGNGRHTVSSSAETVGEDSRHSRDSGIVLDASPMKTRWILDRTLNRLVLVKVLEESNDKVSTETGGQSTQEQRSKEKDAPARTLDGIQRGEKSAETLVGGKTTVQLDTDTPAVVPGSGRNLLGSSDLVAPGQAVGPDIVNYPQDVEDDVNTLSANMPKTVCDNCAISGECKEYSPGAVCYFDDDFGKLPIRNLDANLAEREVLLKFDRTRLMRAIMAERVSGGGALDSRVSQAMDDYIRRKNDFVTLAHKRNTTAVTASLTARGKPGIFSQMFGAAMPTGLRQEGDTEIPLNEPEQANGDVEITMTVTKDVPKKKE